jgi:hypothetical protein
LWLLPMNSNDHSTFGRKKKTQREFSLFLWKVSVADDTSPTPKQSIVCTIQYIYRNYILARMQMGNRRAKATSTALQHSTARVVLESA